MNVQTACNLTSSQERLGQTGQRGGKPHGHLPKTGSLRVNVPLQCHQL
jgi:hypothetical protein